MFFRFSPPGQLHSDQGKQFESELLAEVYKLLGIAKTQTTPYHPQFNRTLLNMLATAATEHPFQWQDHLRPLCMAYNSSVNPTTGHSPFFLMFGRQARMHFNRLKRCPEDIRLPQSQKPQRTYLMILHLRVLPSTFCPMATPLLHQPYAIIADLVILLFVYYQLCPTS